MEFKKIENEMIDIYENSNKEKLVNARELHEKLGNKRHFTNWIQQRIQQYGFIENEEFICFNKFVKANKYGNKSLKEYYVTIDMAKELCMVENNEMGKKMRRYFIEVEKRYRNIIENPTNIFDFMREAINQIEANETRITKVENRVKQLEDSNKEILEMKKKIDVIITKDYCLASDIAEQLGLYSERKLPHSNLIGAIARTLGMKISFKHYYEDKNIAIVPDISKGNDYYQVYYKPNAVEKITRWFHENKSKIAYRIIYERNMKNGKKGDIREEGYKIEKVCYKIWTK